MGTIIVNASLNNQVNFSIKGTITNIDFGDGSPIVASSADTQITHSYSATGIYTITFGTTSLKEIGAGNKYNITSIDLSSSAILDYVEIKSQPYLTSVDLSNNTALLEINIDSCYSLNSFDITGTNNLISIIISKTKLSSIDLTSKSSLGRLGLTNSKLTSINL